MTKKSLLDLQKNIGYEFRNVDLLERALTHRSWAHETVPSGEEMTVRQVHSEALEFVGDSVLGVAIAEKLFLAHPNASEGELTLMKHYLVSAPVLAKLSEKLNIGDFIRFGKSEVKTGGKRKQALLADVFESVLGAIFFDGGYDHAKSFVYRVLAEEINSITPTTALDFKTLFQEKLQAQRREIAVYTVIKQEGPPHKRTFFVEAIWDSGKVEGIGSSIKSAEMSAAKSALEILELETKET